MPSWIRKFAVTVLTVFFLNAKPIYPMENPEHHDKKNPGGDLPVIHESAYVDSTAILCGKIIVEENVFIGPMR